MLFFVFLRIDRIIPIEWGPYRVEAIRPMDIPLIHINVYSIHRDHLFNVQLEVSEIDHKEKRLKQWLDMIISVSNETENITESESKERLDKINEYARNASQYVMR